MAFRRQSSEVKSVRISVIAPLFGNPILRKSTAHGHLCWLFAMMLLTVCLPCSAKVDDKTDDTKPASTPSRRTLDSLARNWLKRPELQHSSVGLEIMDLPTGKVLFSHNGTHRFTPASTAKVFTTACIYELFGPGFTFKTSLLAEGQISGKKLSGNLVLVPSQDPTLDRQDLSRLLSSGTAAGNRLFPEGLKQVDGTLRLAAIAGGYNQFSPAWLVEDWGQDWMPVSSNLVLNRNVEQGAPTIKGVKVIADQGERSALTRTLLNSFLAPGWLSYDVSTNVVRTYRSNHPTMSQSSPLVVGNPDEYNIAIARSILDDLQVKSSGRAQTVNTETVLLAEHNSKPLSTIIQTTLYESDNLYAQQLLRAIGLFNSGANAKDTRSLEEKGLAKLGSWLSSMGIPAQQAILFDGCGLCRKNGISPHSLNTVLRYMAAKPERAGYLNLLKSSDQSSTGRGNYRFKTGAMDTVRSISGVLTTSGGQTLALTIIVNNHTPAVRDLRMSQAALIDQLRDIQEIVTDGAAASTDSSESTPAYVKLAPHRAQPKSRTTTKRRRGRH